VLLALALVFGVLTLFPQIPIAGGRRAGWLRSTFRPTLPRTMASEDLWLNSTAVWHNFVDASREQSLDELLTELCTSVAANASGNLNHVRTQIRRRMWMNWQIAFIMLSLVLLIISVVGWAVDVL
jgi:hypothetical protein